MGVVIEVNVDGMNRFLRALVHWFTLPLDHIAYLAPVGLIQMNTTPGLNDVSKCSDSPKDVTTVDTSGILTHPPIDIGSGNTYLYRSVLSRLDP